MRKPLLIFVALLVIVGCSHKSKEKKQDWSNYKVSSLEKYIYIDKARVLHSKNGCSAVYKDHGMQQVNPVEPVCLTFDDLDKVCSRCFTGQMIDSLRTLFSKYGQSYENVGNLYDDLESRNYSLPCKLQFRKDMREPFQARKIYQILLDEKAEVGTYEEFEEWLGLSKPAKRKSKAQL